MAYIATWLNDALQQKQADQVIDSTLHDLKQRSHLLDGFIPLKTYEGRKWLAYVTKQINTMASVIGFGGELPITQKGQIRKITAEMFKVGLSHVYDEELQWAMMEAMQLANARGIMVQNDMDMNGNVIGGADNSLAALLFGNLQGLVRAHVELLDYNTWQVLQTGGINYIDPRTNESVILDWKDSSLTPYNHFPAALAGGALWSAYSTANGIQDLYNATDTYIDSNGYPPDAYVMSRKLLNHLLQQTSTKEAATSAFLAGGTTVAGTVGIEALNSVLERRGIPKIITFDEKTEMDTAPGVVASGLRFLDSNVFVALKQGMGERSMGGTIENGGAAGVYVATREKQKTPPIDVSEAVSLQLPVLPLISKLGYCARVNA